MYVSVAIDLALDRLFTYEVPVELLGRVCVGQLLRVPFHGRITRGFALALTETPPAFATKPVMAIEDESPFFSPALLKLVKWIASYTASPIEVVLKTAVPASVLKPSARPKELLFVEPTGSAAELTKHQAELLADIVRVGGGWMQQLVKEFKTSPSTLRTLAQKGCLSIAPRQSRRDPLAGRSVVPTRPLHLNDMQARALATILSGSGESAASPNASPRGSGTLAASQSDSLRGSGTLAASPRPVLLHGVTGSGKTEIYLQAIARLLEQGKGAIVLVPEIALTPQTVRRFAGRFGNQVAVLHSALSDGERYDEWHRIRTGEARVVVGPRSAIFAPVANLGLIVVDEEHDPSYKQDETPRYHARDVAVMRARFEGARIVLGSATPSLESWLNAQQEKYELASVPARVAGRSLPTVHLVNMQQELERMGHVPIYSSLLLEAVRSRLDRGEQTILFLNRRGYARVLDCPDCGWVAECPECAVPYTYHRADQCLRCHVCGGWARLPADCPVCHAKELSYGGVGTQRAEAALQACFPRAKILRMDADSTSRKYSHDDILSAFRAGKADVLLGTQMIAKGLDFPNVTLVGVLNADTSLNRPDPRASERTYQLLAQVSGRAGRAEKPGEVYIQTFQPDAAAIAAAAKGDYAAFAAGELEDRRTAYFPPYCRLSTLVFRSKVETLARDWADLYARSLEGWAKKANAKSGNEGFRVSEAAEAPLSKADGWFRYHVVLRTPTAKAAVDAVKWLKSVRPPPEALRIAFDVDALNLM